MKKSLLIPAIILYHLSLPAQVHPGRFDFTLSGKVNDSRTGETLPYATLIVKSNGRGTSANVDGHYTLFRVPSDTSTLIVRYMGYHSKEIQLTPDVEIASFDISLNEEQVVIEEVVITGEDKRNLVMINPESVSQVTMRPAQLAALPGIGERDIFRGLQLLPGISGTNETSSGLYVRGGTPDQNLILYDGFTVYHVDHFYGFFSAFNAEAIKDVQMYKGGFGANYGGKLSSVVDITAKTGNENQFSGSLNISALSTSGTIELPLFGVGSVMISGRRSYTDIIKTGLYNKIYDLYNNLSTDNPGIGVRGQTQFGSIEPDFYFYDLNGKITLKPSEKDVLSLSYYGGKDNLDNSYDTGDLSGMFAGRFGGTGGPSGSVQVGMDRTDLMQWGNHGVSGRWSHKWNSLFYSNTVVAYSNYFSDRDNLTSSEREQEDSTIIVRSGMVEENDVRDLTFRIDNEFQINSGNRLLFGLQTTLNDISYVYTINDTLEAVNKKDRGTVISMYASNEAKYLKILTLHYGLRGTFYTVTEQFYAEPRLSATLNLTRKFKLKGAWGLHHQYVNRVVRESVLEGSRDFWLLSDDKTIPVGSSIHYILGLSWENPFLFISAEAYYKNLDGLNEYSMRYGRQRFGLNETTEYFFSGKGVARGLEFLVQKKSGHLTGWLGYTLGEVIHTFEGMNNGNPFHASHDQTHELKLVGSYEIGRWQLGAIYIYATGKPYTAPIGGYEIIMPDGTSVDYTHVGEKNGFRLPYYARFDISATCNFNFGERIISSVGLSLFNVFNRANVWYREFEIEDNSLYVTDITTLGFTPNVFVTIKF